MKRCDLPSVDDGVRFWRLSPCSAYGFSCVNPGSPPAMGHRDARGRDMNRHLPPKTTRREDPSQPSPWRLQHGDVGPPQRESGPEEAPMARRRAADLLALLEANGTVTPAMRDAGRLFH